MIQVFSTDFRDLSYVKHVLVSKEFTILRRQPVQYNCSKRGRYIVAGSYCVSSELQRVFGN